MPLQTANQYDLNPNVVGNFQQGQQFAQNQQLGQQNIVMNQLKMDQAQQQLGNQQAAGEIGSRIAGGQQTPEQTQDDLAELYKRDPESYFKLQEVVAETAKKVGLRDQRDNEYISKVAGFLQANPAGYEQAIMQMQQDGMPQQSIESIMQLAGKSPQEQQQGLELMSLMGTVGASGNKQRQTPAQQNWEYREQLSPDKQELFDVGAGFKGKQISAEDRDTIEKMKLKYKLEEAEGKADIKLKTEPEIEKQKKIAKDEAALVGGMIKGGVESLSLMKGNNLNLDKAITALQKGAKSGVINQYLPSFREQTLRLEQLQGELGLDVVGSTTFGALSKGELDLAKSVAIPLGLDAPELVQWLQDKKAANVKLMGYINEQIQFLDGGGTVPEWLKMNQEKLDAKNISEMSDDELFN